MSFQQLEYLTKFHDPTLNIVSQWSIKREQLSVLLHDFPLLIQAYQNPHMSEYELNPNITLIDKMPELRLAIACEAVANGLYAMADIAANFANKVSNGMINSKFNTLRKKLKKEWANSEVASILGDLQWYEKIHEIRTEWTHYSSIRIIQHAPNNEPYLYIKSYRGAANKIEFPQDFSCSISDFISWAKNAQTTIDSFGDYLLVEYVVHQFDLTKEIRIPIFDKHGFPVVTDDHLFPSEVITIAEYMLRGEIHSLLLQSQKIQIQKIGIEILNMCSKKDQME